MPTYCGRSRARSWTPQSGGLRAFTSSPCRPAVRAEAEVPTRFLTRCLGPYRRTCLDFFASRVSARAAARHCHHFVAPSDTSKFVQVKKRPRSAGPSRSWRLDVEPSVQEGRSVFPLGRDAFEAARARRLVIQAYARKDRIVAVKPRFLDLPGEPWAFLSPSEQSKNSQQRLRQPQEAVSAAVCVEVQSP